MQARPLAGKTVRKTACDHQNIGTTGLFAQPQHHPADSPNGKVSGYRPVENGPFQTRPDRTADKRRNPFSCPIDSNIFLYSGIRHSRLTEQTENTAGMYRHDERPGKRGVGVSGYRQNFRMKKHAGIPFFFWKRMQTNG